MKLVVLITVCALAAASQDTEQKYDAGYDGYSKKLYHGMYPGKCQADGFYYKDEYSFMMCSNGHAFEQRCAPGSKNSGYERYSAGADYYIHEFCDVNMVDSGYNGVPAPHGKPATSYAKPTPTPTKPMMTYKPAEKAPKVVQQQIHYAIEPPKAHYFGKYSGRCEADGFYYNDGNSFVICSNGNAYVQRCAPGSRNSAPDRYQSGSAYFYNDLCDVNLVDNGYMGQYNSQYNNDYYTGRYYPNPGYFHHRVY